MSPRPSSAWSGAVAGTFLIGTSAPAAAVLRDVPLFAGQAWRSLAVATLLLGVVATAVPGGLRRPTRAQALRLAALSTVGIGGFNCSVVAATRHAEPAVVGTVLAATPVIIAVVAPLRDRRRPHLRVVAGCLLIAGGTAIASGVGGVTGPGLALCALALACEVAFALLAVPLLPALGALRTTAYAFVGSVPVLGVAALVTGGPSSLVTAPTGAQWLALAYLIVPIAIVANLCWYHALSHLRADRASLAYAFTPVGAVVAALVVAGGAPAPRELVGIAVVTVGLLVGLARPTDEPARRVGTDRSRGETPWRRSGRLTAR